VSGAINPDGTSQLVTDDFTTQKLGTGHYRIEFAAGTFTSIPNLVVMPIGKRWVSGSIEFPLGAVRSAASTSRSESTPISSPTRS